MGKDAHMRNDVKLGFAIGGVLLAVLIVYVLVVPGGSSSTNPPKKVSQANGGNALQMATVNAQAATNQAKIQADAAKAIATTQAAFLSHTCRFGDRLMAIPKAEKLLGSNPAPTAAGNRIEERLR